MGLPIWRDPSDRNSSRRDASKPADPTACPRSSIRRRPSVHGRGSTRARLLRDSTVLPPRFDRSPPPSVGFNGLRDPRRGGHRGVPPIASLLEAADRDRLVVPPAPAPEPHVSLSADVEEDQSARRLLDSHMALINERESQLRRNLAQLQQRHARLESADVQEAQTARRRLESHMGLIHEHESQLRRNLAELRQRHARLELDHDYSLEESSGSSDSNPDLRRSSTPPANRDNSGTYGRTINLRPGEPLRIIRSPELVSRRSRPHSRNGNSARRNALPTPPLDRTGSDENVFLPHVPPHPLSNSWGAESPIGGLGDRDRSPTPADGWEIMRSTITPDDTLPSADSSFASAAASQSFNASSDSTQVTEPDVVSLNSRRNSEGQSDSDLDELICTDEDMFHTETFAHDMYMHEMSTSAGRQRIAHHERRRAQEGNRFALGREPSRIDIGFRLIEEALDTEEGRARVLQIRNSTSPDDADDTETTVAATRTVRYIRERRQRFHQDSLEHDTARPSDETSEAAPSRRRFQDEYRDFDDHLRHLRGEDLVPRSESPPQYEPLNSHPDVNTFSSRDEAEPYPVSPPSNRSEREVAEALQSGDVQDLDSLRRIVERLATRDDVPEEWWMSMGLNHLPRTGPRAYSPRRRGEDDVRTGRIERGNSRL